MSCNQILSAIIGVYYRKHDDLVFRVEILVEITKLANLMFVFTFLPEEFPDFQLRLPIRKLPVEVGKSGLSGFRKKGKQKVLFYLFSVSKCLSAAQSSTIDNYTKYCRVSSKNAV